MRAYEKSHRVATKKVLGTAALAFSFGLL